MRLSSARVSLSLSLFQRASAFDYLCLCSSLCGCFLCPRFYSRLADFSSFSRRLLVSLLLPAAYLGDIALDEEDLQLFKLNNVEKEATVNLTGPGGSWLQIRG